MSNDAYFDELRLRLKEAMDLHGWSQSEVHRQSGVPQGTISTFLKGHGLGQENIDRLVELLDNLAEAPVPDSDEVRRAIRLYRYMQALAEQGTTFITRDSDGTERSLLVLW